MTQSGQNYFNDSPIEVAKDDRYGVTGFAESIARSIRGMNAPIGTTIALHGAWGSGKSSVVNLVRAAIADVKDEKLVVSDFKCWWYRGEEALALAFLQNLHGILRTSLGDKVKDLVPGMGRQLLQAGPVIGAAATLASGAPLMGLFSSGAKFFSALFPSGDTLEKTFAKLSKILADENRRFLIIIDDIDRLSTDEAIAVFRLVKSVGRLPNVMYLLVFDRDLAEKAVQARFPSEGPHFLEKIIQAGFEVPTPLQTDLNDAVWSSIQNICGTSAQKQIVRTMNMFYDVVVPYMQTPRHVTRYQNAISVTWPGIQGEVSIADFAALEALRLYEPGLFKAIRTKKQLVCGISDHHQDSRDHQSRMAPLLSDVPEERQALAKIALQRLFPKLENMGYGSDWISQWSAERRVCIDHHFDTYFRLTLSDETLSTKDINEIIERAADAEFVKVTIRAASKRTRRSGTTMVPVYLDELNTHAARIEKPKVRPFLQALFEIHDEIDLEVDADRGFGGMRNTNLRYHWLMRRLTREHFTPAERSDVLVAATKTASLAWAVDFVSSILAERSEDRRNGPKPDEDCLVQPSAIPALRQQAIDAIRHAAENGLLIGHKDLVHILYRWRDFLDGDAAEVRAWTNAQLGEDSKVVALARGFTGQSWSMGMGGTGTLGDRVSTPAATAHIDDDTQIIDPKLFHTRLEATLGNPDITEDERTIIETLLKAWDKKKNKHKVR